MKLEIMRGLIGEGHSLNYMIYEQNEIFLKLSSMTALLAAREWTGLSKVFAQFPSPSKSNYLSRSNPLGNMEHRNLGGLLNVSVIGLGCLPMVGYYGGKYEKKDMIALIRHAYEKGVTFFRYGGGVWTLYQRRVGRRSTRPVP